MKRILLITGLTSLLWAPMAIADDAPSYGWRLLIKEESASTRSGPAMDSFPVASKEVCKTLAEQVIEKVRGPWSRSPTAICLNTKTGEMKEIARNRK